MENVIKLRNIPTIIACILAVLFLSLSVTAGPRRGRRIVSRGHVVRVMPRRHVYFRPAIGARVSVLPFGYSIVRFGGVPYFYYFGTYYRYYPEDNIYVVVEKPVESTQVSGSSGLDVITLVDGSTIEGVYLGGTMTTIQLQVGDEVQEVDIADVASIVIAPEIKEK